MLNGVLWALGTGAQWRELPEKYPPFQTCHRRARLEGRRIGRQPLDVDRAALLRDRARGLSLSELAKAYGISRTSECRILREERTSGPVPKGVTPAPSQVHENRPPETAA